jgi:glycerophosphoryl diester phosphodiesterase
MKLRFLGHRGSGASDAPFNRERDAEYEMARETENTIESHVQALRDGADGSETDLIETADGDIVLVHANDFSQHIFVPQQGDFAATGKNFIDQLTVPEIKQYLRIGKNGTSTIPTLKEYLSALRTEKSDVFVNLELKGKQDTRPNFQRPSLTSPSLAEKTLQIIEECKFPLNQIRFSSFALSYLKDMANLCPEAHLGILFDLSPEQGGDVNIKMFSDRPDIYLPYTPESIDFALQHVPSLRAVHPEVQSLNDENVAYTASKGLKIATWGWKEYAFDHPQGTGAHFGNCHRNAEALCRKHGISELDIITDHIRQTRSLFRAPSPIIASHHAPGPGL